MDARRQCGFGGAWKLGGGYMRRTVPIDDLHLQILVNRGILASHLQHSRCAYASVGIAIAHRHRIMHSISEFPHAPFLFPAQRKPQHASHLSHGRSVASFLFPYCSVRLHSPHTHMTASARGGASGGVFRNNTELHMLERTAADLTAAKQAGGCI